MAVAGVGRGWVTMGSAAPAGVPCRVDVQRALPLPDLHRHQGWKESQAGPLSLRRNMGLPRFPFRPAMHIGLEGGMAAGASREVQNKGGLSLIHI